MAELFADHLGVPPAERKRWLQLARGLAPFPEPQVSDLPATTPSTPVEPPTNLPAPLTSFLGRDHEIIDGCRLVASSRLLTLTGVGGADKTRLALEIARALVNPWQPAAAKPPFLDGIWWVELAPLSDGALIPETVAKVLGLREQPGQSMERLLAETLKTRQMLLLLDNCEHLAAACGQWVQQWLHHSPHLHILATSREPLHLLGEQRFHVAPLAADSASELFVQRARLVDPTFTRTAANGAAIDQLCQQVDYLPLAIELLAARSDLFSPQAMLERLQARPLDLLSAEMRNLPPRQRTLRHTIQHSYDLLTEREQALFRTLGVFVGGFDLAAVTYLGFSEEALRSLIVKSLVQLDVLSTNHQQRFLLLDTLRQYAIEQLFATKEHETVYRQHGRYFLNLVKAASVQRGSNKERDWLDRLARDYANLHTALNGFIESDAETAQYMASLLYGYWFGYGLFSEGRMWVTRALAASTVPTLSRAWVLKTAGELACEFGDYRDAQELAHESLAIFQAQGELAGCAAALNTLGWVWENIGRTTKALEYFEQSLQLARRAADNQLIAYTLANVAQALISLRIPNECIQTYLHESAAIYQMIERPLGLAHVLRVQGQAELLICNHTRAVMFFLEALAIFRWVDVKWEVAWTLNRLGEASWSAGNAPDAYNYWTEALQLFQHINLKPGLMVVWYHLAQIQRCLYHSFEQAIHFYYQSLKLCQEMKSEGLSVRCLIGLAAIALGRCQFDHATHLVGTVQRMIDNQPPFLVPLERAEYAQMINAVRAHLEESIFTAAWIEGQTMTLDEAVAYALTVEYHGKLEKTSC